MPGAAQHAAAYPALPAGLCAAAAAATAAALRLMLLRLRLPTYAPPLPARLPVQVSAIVRAPPTDVFRNLVQLRRTEVLGVLMGARVVEKIDANTQVITQQWKPAGAVGG